MTLVGIPEIEIHVRNRPVSKLTIAMPLFVT